MTKTLRFSMIVTRLDVHIDGTANVNMRLNVDGKPETGWNPIVVSMAVTNETVRHHDINVGDHIVVWMEADDAA